MRRKTLKQALDKVYLVKYVSLTATISVPKVLLGKKFKLEVLTYGAESRKRITAHRQIHLKEAVNRIYNASKSGRAVVMWMPKVLAGSRIKLKIVGDEDLKRNGS